MICTLCPRNCKVDRAVSTGFCGMTERIKVAKAYLHRWEEPCISGTNGSGTVFFSGCNLKCIYCQNSKISQENFGREVTIDELRQIYLKLKREGAHNINLVSPTHYIERIRESLKDKNALGLPVVYNSNGYESLEGLRLMDGVVDVYLPDLKYFSSESAARYSGARDYFEKAASSVLEMYRQVGSPAFDEQGIIKKGLLIRHLILPGLAGESIKILDWIHANLPQDVYISLMSQYIPCYKAKGHAELDRRITRREYDRVVNHLFRLELENGYIQERDSAAEEYIPDFDLEGLD